MIRSFRRPVVAVVRIQGVLGGWPRRRGGGSAAALGRSIDAAFRMRRAAAVALVIDSPGGAPVQASLIAGRIRRLARKSGRPVLAFVEDVAASGGYWIAAAADEIWVDASSLVGSIGVMSAGFGLHEAIRRLGVERRMHARGPLKDFLDPFQPERPEHVAVLEELQRELHARFAGWIKQRRGSRLRVEDAELLSGRLWSGERAVALGLADGLGQLEEVLEERFGPRVRLRWINPPRAGLLRGLVAALAWELVDALEVRFSGPPVRL